MLFHIDSPVHHALWLSEACCGQAEKEKMSGMEKFLLCLMYMKLSTGFPGLTRGQMLHCSLIEVQFVFQTHNRGHLILPQGCESTVRFYYNTLEQPSWWLKPGGSALLPENHPAGCLYLF